MGKNPSGVGHVKTEEPVVVVCSVVVLVISVVVELVVVLVEVDSVTASVVDVGSVGLVGPANSVTNHHE